MTDDVFSEADYLAALERGRVYEKLGLVARQVRYDADRDHIELLFDGGFGFILPRRWISEFESLPATRLQEIAVSPGGTGIEIDSCDIHMGVEDLLADLIPPAFLSRFFAKRGGRTSTSRKRAAARMNGAKGGRPRKALQPV